MTVLVQSDPFDLGKVVNDFTSDASGAGAIVSFTGVVRDLATCGLDVMDIEHYPGMTEKALMDIRDQAMDRWGLTDALIIHRYGRLKAGDQIMMVATASKHRKDAFEAAEFLMDFLKSRAPFWKKEITQNGAEWVASKDEDEQALDRWY